MDMEYDTIQRAYGEYYASAQALPQNTMSGGDDGAQQNSGAMGGIEIITQVQAAMTLTHTGTLHVLVMHATYDSAAYYQTLPGYACSVTPGPGDGTEAYAVGTVLGRFVLPSDTYRYTKVAIKTDDRFATGSLDIFPSLLPR